MVGVSRFTVVAVLDVPQGAVGTFQRYEREVLSILQRHGGVLERRLRTPDGTTEVHVLSFESGAGYGRFLSDPERSGLREMLYGVEVGQRVVEALSDVPTNG